MVGNLAPIRAAFFNGPNGQRLTEDQIRSRELIARTLLQSATDTSPTAGGWASILAKGAQGLASNYQEGKADAAASANLKATSDADNSFYSSLAGTLGGGDASAALPTPGAAGQIAATDPGQSSGILPGSLQSLLDSKESGPGGYNALFGNAQQKQFAGTNVSALPISDVLAFTDPSGAYAQSVKGQIGRVATPVGRYQIVGSTLKNAVNELGLDPSQPFDAATQDKVALHLATQRVASANTLPGKIAALRQEWTGLQSVPDSQLAQVVSDIENHVQTAPVEPVQTASLGPVTPQDAAASIAPSGPYVDPQVTTAYAPQAPQTPNPSVAQALLASPQDVTSAATPVTDVVKGGRVGGPAITQQNFDDRMGGAAPAAAPVAPFDPSTVQDYGTQAPQGAPQGPSPVASQLAAAPIAPRISAAALPPLNPAVIRALQDPNASPQTKQVAMGLLNQHATQAQAAQAQALKAQQDQQQLMQRQALLQRNGIDPSYASDPEAFKLALAQAPGLAAPSVTSVGGVGYDNRTHQPIFGTPDKPTSVQEFEYNQDHPGFAGFEKDMKKAGSQSITVGGGSGTQIFETMNKSADLAQGAATGLNAIREARKAVGSGIISGAGADQRLGLQKLGSFLGVTDPTEITNTETFRAAIAPQISAVLHATAGTANLSDADREFATKAAGGSINLDATSINRILGIMEKAGTNSIKLHNSKVDKVYPDGQGFDRERALFRIDEPTNDDAVPDGVDPKLWPYMTDEQKKLFKEPQ